MRFVEYKLRIYIKISFLVVALVIHPLNILLKCVERQHIFQNWRAI